MVPCCIVHNWKSGDQLVVTYFDCFQILQTRMSTFINFIILMRLPCTCYETFFLHLITARLFSKTLHVLFPQTWPATHMILLYKKATIINNYVTHFIHFISLSAEPELTVNSSLDKNTENTTPNIHDLCLHTEITSSRNRWIKVT
jgi:hypothetical protein